jgi:curved DNA-binding protein CbpA
METTKFTDYFTLLGVTREATKDEVQKAFMAKALQYHPDKASEADRKKHEAIYQDLKEAYRVLSNDSSKKQYLDSQQTTHMDFKKEARDLGYKYTDKFTKVTTDGVKFDNDAFMSNFNETRDSQEAENLRKLQDKVSIEAKVTTSDYERLMEERRREMAALDAQNAQFLSGTGKTFDTDTFNRAFDAMKKKHPGNEVQAYSGDPMGMFSTGGLVEDDNFGNMTMQNGFGFGGTDIGSLIHGNVVDSSTIGGLDIQGLSTGERYGQEEKLSYDEMQERMAKASNDRKRLAVMKKDEFKVEPSEIELMYSGLFAPSEVEGLDAPLGAATDDNDDDELPGLEDRKAISQKVRQKIKANARGGAHG